MQDVTLVGTGGREVTIIGAGGSPTSTVAPSVSVSLEGVTFTGASGRGIVVNGDLTMTGCTVNDCSGGGVAVEGASSTLLAVDTIFEGNRSPAAGGALYVERFTDGAELIRCNVVGNISQSTGGGIASSTRLTLSECLVSGNSTAMNTASGGGVSAVRGILRIDSCLIHDNESFVGAGIYATDLDSIEAVNSTISGNRNTSGLGSGGGAIIRFCLAGSVTGCTVVNNYGGFAGGLRFIDSLDVTVSACVASGNSVLVGPLDLYVDSTATLLSGGFNVIGDAFQFALDPSDVISMDPLLSPLAYNGGPTRTHAPMLGSPCIGLNGGGALGVDQRGAARSGASAESGAFELIGDPSF